MSTRHPLPQPPTWRVLFLLRLLLISFLFLFWIIYHLSGQLLVVFSFLFHIYFMSVCLALGPGAAIESNYNICEEGNSQQSSRYVMGNCVGNVWKLWKCDWPAAAWAIFMLSSDPNQVGQLKTEIHIADNADELLHSAIPCKLHFVDIQLSSLFSLFCYSTLITQPLHSLLFSTKYRTAWMTTTTTPKTIHLATKAKTAKATQPPKTTWTRLFPIWIWSARVRPATTRRSCCSAVNYLPPRLSLPAFRPRISHAIVSQPKR